MGRALITLWWRVRSVCFIGLMSLMAEWRKLLLKNILASFNYLNGTAVSYMDKCLILQIFRDFFFQSKFINEHSHQQYIIAFSLYKIFKMLIMWRNDWLLTSGPLTLGRSEKWQLNFYRIFFSVLQNVQKLHRCNIIGWLLEMPLNYTSRKKSMGKSCLLHDNEEEQMMRTCYLPSPISRWVLTYASFQNH